MSEEKQYADRDIIGLDRAGGYYGRHVYSLTHEKLWEKSAIAAELGWRDMRMDSAVACLREIANDSGDHGWRLCAQARDWLREHGEGKS